MNKFDELTLDGRLLQMLVAVHDEGSVTAAALALGVTQSTVSHGLNRLRDITGDALFVPMGRGITSTEKADALAEEARFLLERMARFSEAKAYDPATDSRHFTIAATDYEVEVIVKPFIHRLRAAAPGVQIRVLRARADREWAGALRAGEVDLVLAPELKTGEADIKQRRVLGNDADVIYYDPEKREAPSTLDAYCAASHLIMAPGTFDKTPVDHALAALGRTRQIAASLPSFAGVASVLHGTDMVALMPLRLRETTFHRLAHCEPPFETPKETISAIWHIRSDNSARHRWMRDRVVESQR